MDKDKYIGRLLDNRYEILEVIGTGGMAVVYKARCHRLNRLVAIKILKDEYSRDEEFRRRFHAESQAVAMLSHPNIVSVYDVSTSDDADFIVMELIDGITLKQYMVKKGILNWKETLHFAIQIGKALEHAHSRGIIHRDIKPHNVMVLKNGSVKVADFGIARVMSQSNTLTKEALGSVHYISPEQAKGGRVDSRSDIYSLGVVMYEMMTGRPPYDGDSPVSIAIQHINGKAQMPSTINPNIPGGLEQIIVKAMEQEPAKRYATAGTMLRDMDEFRKDPTILFDYNNPVSDMDAGARLSNAPRKEGETAPLPVPPVQRPVNQPSRAKPKTQAASQKAAQKTRHRRRDEEIVDDEDRGGIVATVAIIACVLVALVAIGIFVWAFMQGSEDVIEVPELIGMNKAQWEQVTDVIVVVKESKYHDTVPAGEVYDQAPAAGSQIAKGGTVSIYVSLGVKPETAVMEDLIDLSQEAAVKFLVDVLEIPESKILIRNETSSGIAAGNVTRTNPEKGEPLKEDQTIELWISTGPESRTAKVPNVYGVSADMALSLLKANGFDNVRFESVESTRDRDTVVNQSIAANTIVDVTTEIVLQISIGGGDDPEKPTEDPDLVTKVITVELPQEATENGTLVIWEGETIIEEREIFVGTISTQFELTGKGIVTYTLVLNDSQYWTVEVNFNE